MPYSVALEFIQANIGLIIITFIVSGILTGVSIVFFRRFVLGKVSSAQEERFKQAKEELLVVLENNIVNRESINNNTINNLINAVDREYDVPLSESVSPESVLQDLQLRIEKSRHLNPDQKQDYREIIESSLADIQRSAEQSTDTETLETDTAVNVELSSTLGFGISSNLKKIVYQKRIDAIKENIREGDSKKAIEQLESLEDDLTKKKKFGPIVVEDPFVKSFSVLYQNPKLAVLVTIIYFLILFLAILVLFVM